MSESNVSPVGPDLAAGILADDLANGRMLVGHVGRESVLLARHGDEFFAIDASCSHYGGPLVDGIMVRDTVRCPWHHACFSLRTGEALHPPAMSAVSCWSVERRGEKVVVTSRQKVSARTRNRRGRPAAGSPEKIVIVGGGAAGFTAAQKLRSEQYKGSIVMLSDDDAAPVDRPNLSKDYLAGSASENWVPLRPGDFYAENGFDSKVRMSSAGWFHSSGTGSAAMM